MNNDDFDPPIPFVPDGTIVSKARRWARAWKKTARHHDAAGDYFVEEIDKQYKRIKALEAGLREAVMLFADLREGFGQEPPLVSQWRIRIRALLSETPEK